MTGESGILCMVPVISNLLSINSQIGLLPKTSRPILVLYRKFIFLKAME
jgi:hypothetical protein